MSTLPLDEHGEFIHPSGARRPDAQIITFPPVRSHRLDVDTDPPRPDGLLSIELLDLLLGLVTDARSTLTRDQQRQALAELDELRIEAIIDAERDDPTISPVDLPGRAATALLRIVIARGLVREEWDA